MTFTCLFEDYLRTTSGDYLQLTYSVIVRYSAEARDFFLSPKRPESFNMLWVGRVLS